jgi:hypothetical protein
MNPIPATRSLLTGVGAVALLGLALASPAGAATLDQSDAPPPAPVGPPSYNSWPHGSGSSGDAVVTPTNLPNTAPAGYLALGALGGLAVGAGVVAIAVNGHRRHRPTVHA